MSTTYIPGTERGIWARIDEITPVLAFKVGGSIYATPRAAAKKMAWGLILNKYTEIAPAVKLEDVKRVGRYECNCPPDHERGYYGQIIQFRYEACQIHQRKTGYFARLHARLVSIILERHEYE